MLLHFSDLVLTDMLILKKRWREGSTHIFLKRIAVDAATTRIAGDFYPSKIERIVLFA